MKLMPGIRAIQVAAFGGPEALVPVTLAAPVPGEGQAVIAVSMADVLFLDTLIRSGRFGGSFPVAPPYVPGNGVAGHVVATGPGVDAGWAGQRVVAHTGRRGGSDGYAEQVAVAAGRL